jgi:hypothetical protein
MQGYVGPIIVSQGDGPTLSGSSSRTLLLQDQALATLGAQQIDAIGRRFVVRGFARLSTAGSSPGTLTFDLQLGSVIIAASQALALATSQSNITLRFEWELIARAVGATASFIHSGEFKSDALTGGPLILVPASAPAVGNTFNSSDAAKLGLYGTFSSNSGSNSLTVHGYSVESFN